MNFGMIIVIEIYIILYENLKCLKILIIVPVIVVAVK